MDRCWLDPEGIVEERESVHEPIRCRSPWVEPEITCSARLRDCVHGYGKSGANHDADPIFTTKSGIG